MQIIQCNNWIPASAGMTNDALIRPPLEKLYTTQTPAIQQRRREGAAANP
jgi:hypothetical protein